MHIVASTTRVTGDKSPDTPTRVSYVQVLRCLNRHCPHPDEQEIEHEIYPGTPSTAETDTAQ